MLHREMFFYNEKNNPRSKSKKTKGIDRWIAEEKNNLATLTESEIILEKLQKKKTHVTKPAAIKHLDFSIDHWKFIIKKTTKRLDILRGRIEFLEQNEEKPFRP